MNEMEENAFKAAIAFYQKWRETVIETDEQWLQFAVEWQKVFEPVFDCPIGKHLSFAVSYAFSELYKDGAKPMPAGYFGRDDL